MSANRFVVVNSTILKLLIKLKALQEAILVFFFPIADASREQSKKNRYFRVLRLCCDFLNSRIPDTFVKTSGKKLNDVTRRIKGARSDNIRICNDKKNDSYDLGSASNGRKRCRRVNRVVCAGLKGTFTRSRIPHRPQHWPNNNRVHANSTSFI